MPKILLAVLIAAFLNAMINSSPAEARGRRCDTTDVDQILRDIPISSDRVESISLRPQKGAGDDNDRIHGYDATVRLAEFDGVLMIDMTILCGQSRIYTRGHDQIPGIRATCI